MDFPVAQTVKKLPAMQETRVRSLGWEVPLEKGMAIHSSILAWRIPWTKKPGRLQSMGSQRVGHDWATNTRYTTSNDSYHLLSTCSVPDKALVCYAQWPTYPHTILFNKHDHHQILQIRTLRYRGACSFLKWHSYQMMLSTGTQVTSVPQPLSTRLRCLHIYGLVLWGRLLMDYGSSIAWSHSHSPPDPPCYLDGLPTDVNVQWDWGWILQR